MCGECGKRSHIFSLAHSGNGPRINSNKVRLKLGKCTAVRCRAVLRIWRKRKSTTVSSTFSGLAHTTAFTAYPASSWPPSSRSPYPPSPPGPTSSSRASCLASARDPPPPPLPPPCMRTATCRGELPPGTNSSSNNSSSNCRSTCPAPSS